MDVITAIEKTVKPKLEDAFGKGEAMRIMMRAAASTEVPMFGQNPQHFRMLITAICADEIVRGAWGEDGSQAQLEEWTDLI